MIQNPGHWPGHTGDKKFTKTAKGPLVECHPDKYQRVLLVTQ